LCAPIRVMRSRTKLPCFSFQSCGLSE
jgi:hypothetical protein